MREPAIYQKIYAELLQQLMSGKLPEGTVLPAETALAKDYGVSRITSRHALTQLAEEGYIQRTPGRGSVVVARPKKTPLLGLTLSNFDALFGTEFIKGVFHEAESMGYLVILRMGYFIREHEEKRLWELVQAGVQGIINVPLYESMHYTDAIKKVADHVPLVFADREVVGLNVPLVCTDNVGATEVLCQKLYEQGHRKIAFVSSKTDSTAVGERLKGYLQFCERSGMRFEKRMVYTAVRSVLPGMDRKDNWAKDVRALIQFFQQNEDVTAVIAHTYRVAKLVRAAIEQLGCRVPQDLAVVCFDAPRREEEPEFFSHMRQNEFEMGVRSVQRLAEVINGSRVPEVTYVDAVWVEGESCTPNRRVGTP